MRKSFLFILSLLTALSCFATDYTLYGAWDGFTAHALTKTTASDYPVSVRVYINKSQGGTAYKFSVYNGSQYRYRGGGSVTATVTGHSFNKGVDSGPNYTPSSGGNPDNFTPSSTYSGYYTFTITEDNKLNVTYPTQDEEEESPEEKFTVTLTNATAASVEAGATTGASITAAAAPEGKVFDTWTTTTPSIITFTNASSATTTVKANAEGGEATATYRDKTRVRLYYSNPNNWTEVKAYAWKGEGSSASDKNANWPGVSIKSNTEVRNCVTYYYYEYYSEDYAWEKIIFTNGSNCTGTCTSQTGDLSITGNEGKYNNAANSASSGSWYALPEDVNHTVHYSGEGVIFDGTTSALCGETVSFTATADEHYTLLNVKLNGEIITPTAGTYSYTVQSSDDAINVVGTAIHENAPRTTIQALVKSEYNGGDNTVRVYFMNRSADFLVLDSPSPDVANSEYAMNNLGEQTIDGHSGILYELSYVGTCKLAIFVSKDGYHIGSGNKLTLNDVDMQTSAPATYYFDLSDVTAGSPAQETFNDFHVALHDGYATFCYPSDVTVSDAVPYRAELTANSSETSGYQIDLYPLDGNNVPANTGVLLYSDAGNSQATINIAASDVPALSETNDFIGTIARVSRPVLASGEKIFVLSDISGIAFYEYTPEYIPAYRAYFRLTPTGGPASAPKRAKIVMHHNTATDVENVQSNNVQCTKMLRDGNLIILRDGIEYNVQGQRIQ